MVCHSFPNHAVLKTCFFFLPSGWGLHLLVFPPGEDSTFSQLLAPRASAPWSFLTAGFHGHGALVTALGDFSKSALRPYCFYHHLKISLNFIWG